MISRRMFLQWASVASLALGPRAAGASNAPGVTDTEIKIGQTMPYSGPASAYGLVGRAEAAYFKMINEQGGIGGRKINLVSLDDGYSAPKTVEQTRRLIEQEGVAFIFGSLGGFTNLAIRQYLNDNKIPHLFLATAADLIDDPEHFPWTLGGNPAISTEAHVYAKYILATKPNAKIGVLYQNDALGKGFATGMREGLGAANVSMIVKEVSYEVSDPTVDSQVIELQGSGADTLILGATPKAAAQAIRKAYDLGWWPDRFREIEGRDHRDLRQGPERPTLEGRSGHKGMGGLRRQVSYARGFQRCDWALRLCGGDSDDPGPQTMWRRSLPRQHHAPGAEHPGLRGSGNAPRRFGQHISDQLLSAPPIATFAFQRRELGAVRRYSERLKPRSSFFLRVLGGAISPQRTPSTAKRTLHPRPMRYGSRASLLRLGSM
jgi:hypothetical protein